MSGSPTRAPATEWCTDSPVTVLKGVGARVAERLAAAGIRTLGDLLHFFPRRVAAVATLAAPVATAEGLLVRLKGRVQRVTLQWLPGRRSMVMVTFASSDGTPFLVPFFNQPYLRKAYTTGQERVVEGVLQRRGRAWQLKAPRIVPESAADAGPMLVRYPEIEGVGEARLRTWIQSVLAQAPLARWPEEPLPPQLALDHPPLPAALRAMHAPASVAEHEAARRRFAVREAAALFRRVERARRLRLARRGPRIEVGDELLERIRARLPFAWTDDQQRAVQELRQRLRGPAPMGVLLQGDVGTGKTAVAWFAALAVVAAGWQVAFLAPTELLAEQHHATFAAWLAGSRVALHLLSAARPPAERRAVEAELGAGRCGVVFGTHALLTERTVFARLGLVIVDEQHRFGVAQRMALVHKGEDPHVLVMSATPIPRTLALALFGDLDGIVLRSRPGGRRPPRAFWLAPREWRRVLAVLRRALARGEQAYVVAHRIGAAGERGSAVEVQRALARHFACRLVHGRMPAEERQGVLAEFRAGAFPILVGTTVLEVGVDVPDATVMVVVEADRFGLATLHQLRGRVGRGRRRGICLLVGEASERVRAVCATTDGFELAEADLRLRGAGELLGQAQSGDVDLRALDPVGDHGLLQRVRDAVRGEAGMIPPCTP
ncbi:MAG: ATP-dependent DNA helicase RecG [Planctomycetes bacterium]|nr:ATP-dependent DNA helicase RecG [Planctomycetota bacterium]